MPDEGHRPGGPLPGRRSTGRDHDRFAELEEDPAARSVDGLGDAGGMLQLYGSKPFNRRFPRESLTISSESREHPRWVLRLRGYKTTCGREVRPESSRPETPLAPRSFMFAGSPRHLLGGQEAK